MPSALLLQGELPEWAEDHIQAQWAEIKRLKADIERLRAALQYALTRCEGADEGWPIEDIAATVRAALGDKLIRSE